jgi:hypothetical protein
MTADRIQIPSAAVLTEPRLMKKSRWTFTPDSALNASVGFWFIAALLGQLAFVYYILGVYGPSTVTGNFPAWNKNPVFRMGYVAGDSAGNIAFAVHALLAAVVTVSGALQLIPQVRARAIWVHRWNGRVFILSCLVLSVAGLYMKWIRGARGSMVESLSTSLNAVLIIGFACLAWRAVVSKRMSSHRRWALRTYLVVNAQWFRQVGVFAWVIVNMGKMVGITKDFEGPFMYFWDFGCFILPLAILELYLRTRDSPVPRRKIALASGFVLMTILTIAGTVGVAVVLWVPIVKIVHDTRKSIAETLSSTMASASIDQAIQQYHNLKATNRAAYNFDESELNKLGYKLIGGGKFKEAIRIFQLNVEAYPQSSNAYDSLADAYMDDGEKSQAIINYQASLRIDRNNSHAAQKLQELHVP